MKRKLVFIFIALSIISVIAATDSPYARRIRPVTSLPSCTENEIAYNMTDHSLNICTNSGYQPIAVGSLAFANQALSNLTATSINASLLPNAAGTLHLGSNALQWNDLFIGGTVVGQRTRLISIATGSRTATLPDETGTICTTGSVCSGYGNALTSGNLSQFASTTSALLRGVISDENGIGVALFDSSTSATFITPNLGIPTTLTLTNATGLPVAGLSNLGSNVGTFLITPSGANLATALTTAIPTSKGGTNCTASTITCFNNITGFTAAGTTGTTSTNLVFSIAPTFITPTLGAATATSINGNIFTTGTYTLTGTAGKTLNFTNTLTFSGTDSTTMTFPATTTTVGGLGITQTWTGVNTLGNGTGAPVIVNGGSSSDIVIFNQNGTNIGSFNTASGLIIVNGRSGNWYDGGSLASPGNLRVRIVPGSGINGGVFVGNDNHIGFTSATSVSGSPDTSLWRNSTKVINISDGAANNSNGWFNYAGGQCFLQADQTNATTTFASINNCTINVISGRRYTFKAIFYLSDSIAADGAKINFNGGAATATNFRVHCTAFDSALNLSSQGSALATAYSASTFTGAGMFECHGTFEPSSSSTFIPQFAQNAHTTGTLTLARGSNILFQDVGP